MPQHQGPRAWPGEDTWLGAGLMNRFYLHLRMTFWLSYRPAPALDGAPSESSFPRLFSSASLEREEEAGAACVAKNNNWTTTRPGPARFVFFVVWCCRLGSIRQISHFALWLSSPGCWPLSARAAARPTLCAAHGARRIEDGSLAARERTRNFTLEPERTRVGLTPKRADSLRAPAAAAAA